MCMTYIFYLYLSLNIKYPKLTFCNLVRRSRFSHSYNWRHISYGMWRYISDLLYISVTHSVATSKRKQQRVRYLIINILFVVFTRGRTNSIAIICQQRTPSWSVLPAIWIQTHHSQIIIIIIIIIILVIQLMMMMSDTIIHSPVHYHQYRCSCNRVIIELVPSSQQQQQQQQHSNHNIWYDLKCYIEHLSYQHHHHCQYHYYL